VPQLGEQPAEGAGPRSPPQHAEPDESGPAAQPADATAPGHVPWQPGPPDHLPAPQPAPGDPRRRVQVLIYGLRDEDVIFL